MNKFLKTADTFVGGVLLVGCMPSFFILIAIVGIFRSCMGCDEIDIDNSIMVQRYMYDRADIRDSTGNGYELLWFTTNAVTDKRYEEIKSRQHLRKSYDSLKRSAADHFRHDLISTDIYDFAKYAKQFDIDSADVRLVNIFVCGKEYEALYRQPHPDYPDGTHYMDSHHDLGELYITENDIYPYNPDVGRTYRYWGCEAKTKADERHTHITKWDRERATNRK
ncbi:MAG: hypothetical protein SNF93_07505 [Rikenellaceae bacterium]